MREIVRRGYNAGDYPGVFRSRSEPNEIEQAFLGTLLGLSPANPTVLDLGCGSGVPIDAYLAAKGARLTGVDFSVKHLVLARRNVPSGRYIEADFSTVDLGAGRFDTVVSLYAIFHIPRDEHKALLEKIAGALKDGACSSQRSAQSNRRMAKTKIGRARRWRGVRTTPSYMCGS
jgi:cyclopropane fatty-acyl-phospholipid synthase-like methyltransferase